MRILTWNVQGLGGGRQHQECRRLQEELNPLNIGGHIDILLLQEHHLSQERTQSLVNPLSGGWTTWWSAAQGDLQRRAGVCISISDKARYEVTSSGTLVEGRALYVLLKWNRLQIGVLNIYAPNSAPERAIFWRMLATTLPDAEAWVMAGDFNMTEHLGDRKGGTQRPISGAELDSWAFLIGKIGVKDTWGSSLRRSSHSLYFSRAAGNARGGCLARLDRIYISSSLEELGGSFAILAGLTFSDHQPVRLDLNPPNDSKGSLNVRIPAKIMKSEEVKAGLQSIWQDTMGSESASEDLQKKLALSSSFLQQETKRALQQVRATETKLRKAVAAAQRLLQVDPGCTWSRAKLEEAKMKVQERTLEKNRMLFRRNAAWWARKDDKVNRHFFHYKAPKGGGGRIQGLRKPDGSITEDKVEILEMATQYYRDLLAPMHVRQNTELTDRVMSCIHPKVTQAMEVVLDSPISRLELSEALKGLRRGACPGPDGLSRDFFEVHWECVIPALEAGVQEIWSSGKMPIGLAEGMIYLIPKASERSLELRQWRPITILNTAYKILAKVLARRLASFLPDIIHDNQTGFVKNRCIFDNVLLLWEAMALAGRSVSSSAILMLDFEKAYDRVQWPFLENVMRALGLPPKWRNCTSALYRTATSSVLMAGSRGPAFQLQRSVRQGCPLAPYLYLFVTEAFSAYLQAPTSGLRGLPIPNATEDLLLSEYADDTVLFLQGDEENLQRTEHLVEDFCEAAGAKINWDKTQGLWFSKQEKPRWQPHADFMWVPDGTMFKYLGFMMGRSISKGAQLAHVQAKINKKLNQWSRSKLSFAGRILVANQVLLATMWHSVSCWIMDPTGLHSIKAAIRGFIWSGKDNPRAAARVSWSWLTQPRAKGGLGLIDPLMQSRALLAKMVVRCLLPGKGCWKVLLRNRLQAGTPKYGRPWPDSLNWCCTSGIPPKLACHPEDRVANSILRAWCHLRQHLVKHTPETLTEWTRQPLFWNPHVRTNDDMMLGQLKGLAWGKLAQTGLLSIDDWRCMAVSGRAQEDLFPPLKGATKMRRLIAEAVDRVSMGEAREHAWFGLFDEAGLIKALKGVSGSGRDTVFGDSQSRGSWHPIRVVAQVSNIWKTNPNAAKVEPHWRLRVYDCRPLVDLDWDLGDFRWKHDD